MQPLGTGLQDVSQRVTQHKAAQCGPHGVVQASQEYREVLLQRDTHAVELCGDSLVCEQRLEAVQVKSVAAGSLGEERSEKDQHERQDREQHDPRNVRVRQEFHVHCDAEGTVDGSRNAEEQNHAQDVSRERLHHIKTLGCHIVRRDYLGRDEPVKRDNVKCEPSREKDHYRKAAESLRPACVGVKLKAERERECCHSNHDGNREHEAAETSEVEVNHVVPEFHINVRAHDHREQGEHSLPLVLNEQLEHRYKHRHEGKCRCYAHDDAVQRHQLKSGSDIAHAFSSAPVSSFTPLTP